MATKAYQRIYTRLEAITKATVALKAKGITNDELAVVHGKLAQVVKTKGDLVTLQVFSGTEGIPTDAEVTFLGEPPVLRVSDQLSGRFFNAYGHPIDGGPEVEGEEREIGGPSVNPYKRRQPSELIPTGIAGIDLNNTIVSGQKIPFFADPDQPYNQVMAFQHQLHLHLLQLRQHLHRPLRQGPARQSHLPSPELSSKSPSRKDRLSRPDRRLPSSRR